MQTEKKKLLLVDEAYLAERFRPEIESWGYGLFGIAKSDFLEEAIERHQIDLLIIAKEMRISGPSLFESIAAHPKVSIQEHYLKMYDTIIDYEWGVKLIQHLSSSKNIRPYIFLTTDDVIRTIQWQRNSDGKIYSAIVSKYSSDFYGDLRRTIATVLAG